MGIKVKREKPRHLLVSILYRLLKLPLSDKAKFKLFLDLEWVLARLANELSMHFYKPNEHPWRRQDNEFILSFIKPEYKILDLGCAKGDLTHIIADKAALTVGVDRTNELVDIAKQKYENEKLRFVCMDAIDFLQKTEERFDVLILSHVLEHIDEPEDFLKRFKDFFNYIYIEVPDFDSNLLHHYRKDLDLQLNYNDADHVSEFDRYELFKIFKKCDLRVLRSDYIFGVQRYWCEVA